jgi:hypothetical protein
MSVCLSLLPDMYQGNSAKVIIGRVTVVPFLRFSPLGSGHPDKTVEFEEGRASHGDRS